MSAIRKTAPAARPAAKTMSIGVVLERLREEFPDVTVSKIRFLESEGLITPERTASGYRRFTDDDVERLRYILVTQRDNYLPLKVIREQLDAMDSGKVAAVITEAAPVVKPETFRASAPVRLTDTELAQQAKAEDTDVAELIKAGMLTPDASGLFGPDDVHIVATAGALQEFGFEARHLKSMRTAASRQADLVSQVTDPVARSGKESARQEAEEMAQQISALVVSLHAALVKNELRSGLAR